MNDLTQLRRNAPGFLNIYNRCIPNLPASFRMGYWQDRLTVVFIRDFAYPHPPYKRIRMANGNIYDTSAQVFAELLSGPLVDVYVGEGKRHWSLHQNLLCHHSAHLASELLSSDANRKKTESKQLDLPDDDPAGFELFVKWLYQGKIDDVSQIPEERKYDYAVACHKLYLLCDRFELPQLKNVAMDQYRKGLSEARLVPDAEEINDIYNKSPSGSPFRKLMTKIAARQIMDPDTERDAEYYRPCFESSPSFAVDLVNAIKAGTGGLLFNDPTDGDFCEYHEHENGPDCHGRPSEKVRGKTRRRRSGEGTESSLSASANSSRSSTKSPPTGTHTSHYSTPPTTARRPAPPRTPPKTPDEHSPSRRSQDTAKHYSTPRPDGFSETPRKPTSTGLTETEGRTGPGRGSSDAGGGTPKRPPPKLRRRGSRGSTASGQ